MALLVAAYAVGNSLDISRRNIIFAYDLEPAAEERYKALVGAIARMAGSSKVWFVKAKGDITNLHAWRNNSELSALVDNRAGGRMVIAIIVV